MKILIVTHYALPHTGGIEQATFNHARALVKDGHHVTIVSSAFEAPAGESRLDGIRIVRVPASRFFERISGVPYTVFGPRLARILRTEIAHADIIHAHGSLYQSSWAAARAAREAGKPLVLTEHVGFVPYRNPILRITQHIAYNIFGRRTLRQADRIIILTDEVCEHVCSLGARPESIRTVPNGIDTNFFHPASAGERAAARAVLGIPPGAMTVVFNGRLVEKKGFRLLLAAREAQQRLLFIGEGAIPAEYRAEENVHFLGRCSQTQVRQALHAADVYALPSVGEGFPVATMEALACGLPIVVTDSSSNRQYLSSREAILIAAEPHAIRAGIKRALRDRRALRRSAHEYAQQNCSIESSAHKLESVYAETLAVRNG